MSLRYIIGSEGSGKTEWMYREMLRLCEERPDCSVYYLVPDQATLQAQKDLVARHKNGCVMNIDILSFSRLKYRLIEELGDCFPMILTDIGKSMVLKKVLCETDDRTVLYSGKHKKPGFVSEMKSMISEFQRYLVDADKLQELSEASDDLVLKDKLSDLSIILTEFRNSLGDRFLTEEDIYTAMCPLAERSKKLKGAYLFLNGFTGFTPSQFQLLRSLMRVSGQMTFALTMDEELFGKNVRAESVFHITAKTIASLGKIADEEGIPVEKPVLLSSGEDKDALSFVQNHLLRNDGMVYRENADGVVIRSARSISEEIRFLVTEIERLVRKEGLRYRDIGVIAGDVPTYAQELSDAFFEAEIPCYIDYKPDLMNDPLIDLIRSALTLIVTDFRADRVAHYTKNVISGYDYTDACRFENYLLAKGIRGFSAYRKPFNYKYSSKHEIDLADINRIREALVSDIAPLWDSLKEAKTGADFVQALYDFLLRHECYERMKELSEKAQASDCRGALRKSREFGAVYASVIEVLDSFYQLLGEMPLSAAEFVDILDAGFSEFRLGMIPPSEDSVTVGDLKRSRIHSVKHLFFLGVNEGVVPGGGQPSLILTEKERDLLTAMQVELGDTPKDGLSTEEFYIYLACAKPTEGLTLSYTKSGSGAAEKKPSYILYRILGLLPKLQITSEQNDTSLFSSIAADRGRRLFLSAESGEGEVSEYAKALAEWFLNGEGRKYLSEDEAWINRARNGEIPPEAISEVLSRALYGNVLKGSVTMLEKYARCPYSVFLDRGLGLEERPVYGPTKADSGTLIHDALWHFSENVKASGQTFRLISDEDAARIMDETIDGLLKEEGTEIYRANERYAYQAYRLKGILSHMVEIIRKQLKAGRFEPEEFEKEFAFRSEHMDLHGKIDRVDVCHEDGRKYVKIIDYKSGKTEFSYGDLYDGLLLQLPVYMKELIREDEAKNVPSAMFYSRTDDPFVEDGKDTEVKRLAALKPSGVILDDSTMIPYLDNGFFANDTYTSDIVPLKKKDGIYEDTLSDEEFRKILAFAEEKMETEAKEILDGNIRRRPINQGFSKSCDYCDFRELCKDFGSDPRERFRVATKLKKPEFFEKIDGKEES